MKYLIPDCRNLSSIKSMVVLLWVYIGGFFIKIELIDIKRHFLWFNEVQSKIEVTFRIIQSVPFTEFSRTFWNILEQPKIYTSASRIIKKVRKFVKF